MRVKRHVARRPLASVLTLVIAAAATGSPWLTPRVDAAALDGPDSGAVAEARRAIGAHPMRFEENRGQAAADVAFVANGIGHRVALGGRSATIALGSASLVLRFAGDAQPEAADPLPGETNYLTGRSAESWRTGVAAYGRVLYPDVFPGVSASFSGTASSVDLDLELAPGADAGRVTLDLDGVTSARLLQNGDVELETAGGTMTILAPAASQEDGGARAPVASSFVLRGSTLGLSLGAHDASKGVRVGTTLKDTAPPPPSGKDEGWKVTTDAAGNIYVAGTTESPAFPSVSGLQGAMLGEADGFLAKLSPNGQLLYSTFLGGTAADAVHAVAVDSQNNIYLVGSTASTDFPVANAVQPANRSTCRDCYDAFVTKLDPSGSAILFSTYLGGAESEDGNAVAIDPSGNITVAGATNSPDFPVVNAVQATYAGGGDCGFPCPDAWAAKLSPTGAELLYATYVGGEGYDAATDVAVDAAGNAYLTGLTDSPSFPLVNPLQATLGGEHDGFVTAVASDGASFVYSTYLGGVGPDAGGGIVVDGGGTAYVAGYSYSLDYPTVSPLQTANAGTFRSTDGAAQWSKVNGGLEASYNFLSVAVDPNDSRIVYLGSWRGGVYKSTNGGSDWSVSNAGMTDLEVSALAVAPSSPSTVYAGTPYGVEKSLDGGARWSPASKGLPSFAFIQSLVVDPTDADVVYAAGGDNGLFKTTDGGLTWVSLQENGIVDSVHQIAIDPADPQTLYAASFGQIFTSNDGGESWIGNAGGLPSTAIYAVAVAPGKPSTVYAGSSGAGVFKSTDGAQTWTSVTGGLPTAVVTSIAVDPANPSTVYVGAQGERSFRLNKRGGAKAAAAATAGVAFEPVRPTPAGRVPMRGVHAGAQSAAANATAGAANTNGGVFKTTDGGVTWASVNTGLVSNGVTAIAVAPSSPSTIFASTVSRGDATLTVYAPGGHSIVSSTYLGGSDTDEARAIARDTSGNLYLAGITYSVDFPTQSPVQANIGPHFWGDGFATRLNPSGTAITGSTFLGGADDDSLASVAVDPFGSVVVTGLSWSSNYPVANARQPFFGGGGTDAVVSKIPASFGSFAFSSYLGGYSDTPYISGAGFFKGGLLVEGNFFTPGAVVYVNGVAQFTLNLPETPTTVLIVPRISVKVPVGGSMRIQVRNTTKKFSNVYTLAGS